MPAPLKPQYTLNIERLLLIVEQYVLRVEEVYQSPRSILPHGLSFYGFPLTLNCECETSKEVFSVQVSGIPRNSIIAASATTAYSLCYHGDRHIRTSRFCHSVPSSPTV